MSEASHIFNLIIKEMGSRNRSRRESVTVKGEQSGEQTVSEGLRSDNA